MTNITRLKSRTELSLEGLREWLVSETNAKALVIIVKQPDDTYEVAWSRQPLCDLAYASRRLEQEVRWLMDGVTPTVEKGA